MVKFVYDIKKYIDMLHVENEYNVSKKNDAMNVKLQRM